MQHVTDTQSEVGKAADAACASVDPPASNHATGVNMVYQDDPDFLLQE